MEERQRLTDDRPTDEAVEKMRHHREKNHKRPFDLERHVSYPGHRRSRAPMTYSPQHAEQGARFHCKLCPGYVGLIRGPEVPVDYSEPDAQALWLRRNPKEAMAVRGMAAELRPRAIAAFEHGEIAAQGLNQWLRKEAQASSKRGRPKDAGRREACQRWMLERHAQGFTVQQLIEGLEAMQRDEPEAWEHLTGGRRNVGESALMGYWGKIPISEREAARARWLARPEGERKRELARRRAAKVRP